MSINPSSLKEKFPVVQYVPWELKRTYFLQVVDKDGTPDNRVSLIEVPLRSDSWEDAVEMAGDDFAWNSISTIIGPDEEVVMSRRRAIDEGGYVAKWEVVSRRKDTGEETCHEMFFKLIECGDNYIDNEIEET